MSISAVVYIETISGNRKRNILGVYSSQEKAWQAFAMKVGKYPYSSGSFHYSNISMYMGALQAGSPTATMIRIYTDSSFEIHIQWNILDKPLP